MKGDFTRDTFHPEKHYQQVLMQQGRAQLDADWNEQAALASRRAATTTVDLLGDCGGPADHAAFAMFTDAARLTDQDKARLKPLFAALPAAQRPVDLTTWALTRPGDFYLSPGRYYVDGIQCENVFAVPLSAQPDRLDQPLLPVPSANQAPASYLVYLDVWHRHLTALDDDSMREPALGGPDTGTRVKTVWQVKWLPVVLTGDWSCATPVEALTKLMAPSDARLTADTVKAKVSTDPCEVPETAGYKGLENQLYRVEVHLGSADAGGPTWKWSRENGSVIASLTRIKGDTLTVSTLGPDDRLGFRTGDWVEILDDGIELAGAAGQLLKVIDFNPTERTLKLQSSPTPLATGAQFPDGVDPSRHPKVRRWEGTDQVVANKWLALESGVQVRFDNAAATYRPGDFWQIPARAATATAVAGDIEWPRENSQPVSLPPRGVKHHYCRLGVATVQPDGKMSFTDCRCLTPALNTVPRIFYVSGDGQEKMPDLTPSGTGPKFAKLPQPLVVGVANPGCLDQPLRIRFRITTGAGRVAAVGGALTPQFVDVPTDANGLARCEFYLDSSNYSQQVTARLLDATNSEVSVPIIFNANLSVASQVAYQPGNCDLLASAADVQTALDQLCAAMPRGGGCRKTVAPSDSKLKADYPDLATALADAANLDQLCLCLLPGKHTLPKGAKPFDGLKRGRLTLCGCGAVTPVVLEQTQLVLSAWRLVAMHHVFIEATQVLEPIVFADCEEVSLVECAFRMGDGLGILANIAGAKRVVVERSLFEATTLRYVGPRLTEGGLLDASLVSQLAQQRTAQSMASYVQAAAQALMDASQSEAGFKLLVKFIDSLKPTGNQPWWSARFETELKRVLEYLAQLTPTNPLDLAHAAWVMPRLNYGVALAISPSHQAKPPTPEDLKFPMLPPVSPYRAPVELAIQDSAFAGEICLFGDGPAVDPASDLESFLARWRKMQGVMALPGGEWRIEDNDLYTVTLARPWPEMFFIQAGDTVALVNMPSDLWVERNSFRQVGNGFCANRLGFSGNSYTASFFILQWVSPKLRVPPPLFGFALAKMAVYLGNRAALQVVLDDYSTVVRPVGEVQLPNQTPPATLSLCDDLNPGLVVNALG